MFHRSSKRIPVGILTALLLLAMPAPAAFAGIIIDPAESCRAERDRADENRRSGTKLVVKPSKKSWIKFDLGALDVDHLKTATLMVAAIFVAAIASQARQTQTNDDPVTASFERALHHEVGPAARATRSDIDNDVLYALVNQPLQTQDSPSVVLAQAGGNND